DGSGNTAIASHLLTVVFSYTIAFSFPSSIEFSRVLFRSSLEGLSFYYWDFGDGTGYVAGAYYGISGFVTHSYSRSGTFFVVLTAYNYTGGSYISATASHILVVVSSPVAADFSPDRNSVV